MWVIADLSIVPLGVGLSLSRYVAACERILRDAGLEPRLHAYGTNVEGEWDAVFAALKANGVLIKNLNPAGGPLAACLRVTVGRPEENNAFLQALQSAIA